MKRLLLLACGLVIAGILFVASALPAFGDDTGVVNATISVAAPCITVSPSSAAFPSAPFTSLPGQVGVSVTEEIEFANCSTFAERVLARGTDAAGPTGAWDLYQGAIATCADLQDRYVLGMGDRATQGNVWGRGFSTVNAPFQAADESDYLFAAGSVNEAWTRLIMPCTGSSGAGEEMSFQIVLTATF